MEQVVANFLHRLRVPVARQECLQLIRSHPDYPSLVSVSDTLDSLGVDNYVAQFEDEELGDIAFPYLTHLAQPRGGELVLIATAAELAAARTRPGSTWTGIIVQANGLRVSAPAEQAARYTQERKLARVGWLVLAAAAVLLAQPAWLLPGWLAGATYLAALAGLFVGGLLLAKELGVAPELVEDFCGSGPKAGCDDVLATDPVQLFGFFTLTDAAAAYFLWQVASLALAAVAPGAGMGIYSLVSVVALLGVPVVAFSLYQQYWVAKAWCRLCLLVDAVLLLQAGLALYAISRGDSLLTAITPLVGLNAGLALLACGGLVVLARQQGLRQNELRDSEAALRRGKNAVALFTDALLRQPQVDTREFDQEMVIGSDEAPLEIIMASNPYCAPCKKGHEQLTRLVALYPDKLRVRFRLVVSGADTGRFPTANQYLLQYWLTNIWGQPNAADRTSQLLHEWYEKMNLDRFATTHPADFSGDYSLSTKLSTQHYSWVKQSRVAGTPTYFLNGYQLPAAYRLPDLKLLVPALAEYFSQDVATV
jgi:uncharacterized membrane protein/thiol-disulfide isomerase/thioredoxin